MKTAAKKCKGCTYCKAVYELNYGAIKYRRYYCTFYERITKPEEGCENRKTGKRAYDLSDERFERAEEDIRVIFAYLGD